MKPRLVRELRTSDGRLVREFPVQPGRRVMNPAAAEQMRSLMESVVTKGTGGKAALENFEVAGKTGTAKKFIHGGYNSSHYFGSFVGFFPARNPVAAIIVTVDEPTTAGKAYYGGTAAAPVFRQIALDVANFMKLSPTILSTNSATAAGLHLGGAAIARNP